MSRYLRFFTAVGDDNSDVVSKWHNEEFHDTSEAVEPAKHPHFSQLAFRDALKRLFTSEKFQVEFYYFSVCHTLITFNSLQ